MGFGSSNNAQKQAEADQKTKDAEIASSQAGVNAIFDDPKRQAQYDKLGADTTRYYTDDVNREEAINARKLKFAMARSGLAGGSEQAYQGQQLGQDYSKAIIGATRAGQQAEAQLKSSDESSRENLLAMATAGLDAGTAANRSTAALQNNRASNESTATANSLANNFADFSQIYQQSQDQKAARAGTLYGYGQFFSPMFGAGSSGLSNYNNG